MTFGGMLDSTGILGQLLDVVLRGVKRTGDLILATVGGGFLTNVLAADQFLAITLPGRLFTPAYDDRGLNRLSLSRTLEDSATLIGVTLEHLWAFMAATLGVATFEYAPYALFNLICPVLAVIFGYLMIAQPAPGRSTLTAAQWDFADPYLWSVTVEDISTRWPTPGTPH